MLASRALSNTTRSQVGQVRWMCAAKPTAYNDFGSPKSRSNLKYKPEYPISPHVNIYRFPLPALTSIANRIAGTALAIGFVGVSAGVLVNPAFAMGAVSVVKSVPVLHFLTKFAVAFGGTYHIVAGLRHFYWDFSSKGLNTLAEIDQSSRIVAAASVLLAFLIVVAF